LAAILAQDRKAKMTNKEFEPIEKCIHGLFQLLPRSNWEKFQIEFVQRSLSLMLDGINKTLNRGPANKEAAVLPPTTPGQNVLPDYTLKADASPVA
jgi:hypothetical protein